MKTTNNTDTLETHFLQQVLEEMQQKLRPDATHIYMAPAMLALLRREIIRTNTVFWAPLPANAASNAFHLFGLPVSTDDTIEGWRFE